VGGGVAPPPAALGAVADPHGEAAVPLTPGLGGIMNIPSLALGKRREREGN